LVNIVSPTLLNEPGLCINLQAGAISIVVASKRRIPGMSGEHSRVSATSGRFEVVIFNYTAFNGIGLYRTLSRSKNVIISNLTAFESVEEETACHESINHILASPNRNVVLSDYKSMTNAKVRIL
jgi:hypothetical protein